MALKDAGQIVDIVRPSKLGRSLIWTSAKLFWINSY